MEFGTVFSPQNLVAHGLPDAEAEIVGLSNDYSDYVVTEEEYAVCLFMRWMRRN